jgi:hypothetical protein
MKYVINMNDKPKAGIILIDGGNFKEVISYNGFESPVIDKNGKVIKNGKLLNVKRNI